MSFNIRSHRRHRLGPRFGEQMGKLCHQAITHAHRNNREGYDSTVQEIYQMLDTIETETWSTDGKTKELGTSTQTGDSENAVDPRPAEVEVHASGVATKSKPNKKSGGASKKSKTGKKGAVKAGA